RFNPCGEQMITIPKVVATRFEQNDQDHLSHGLRSIGIGDLNTREISVVIKVGVFSAKTRINTTVNVIEALVTAFDKAPRIYLVESDSYGGSAESRLGIWNRVYDDRVIPFSLSSDKNTREAKIAGEQVSFSHILFKPNVFISTHVPRRYQDAGNEDLMNMGSVLKNLLGLIPDLKKSRFHKKLPTALLDMYEAIGGIDLALLDSTHTFLGVKRKKDKIQTNLLLIGRDAVSVEAVGQYLVGLDPMKNPVIVEAMKRGLGEGDIHKIEILGNQLEDSRENIIQSFRALFPKRVQKEKGWI
ncbi:MAG: DUF362 domain-containing protein, partial [Candidatus Bathyarchaeota archaeon]|nr:DUF362 domain-containing protein [Candidatus Bathyarchaeota archaeon]